MANPFDQFDTPVPASDPGILSKIQDAATTAIRGFGEGATAGLIKYPQAALLSSTNPNLTYKQALGEVRSDNANLAATQPKAWIGGNLAGAGVSAIATGGTTAPAEAASIAPSAIGQIARAVGSGAAYGGAQGYSQNNGNITDIRDAATGAALGGAIGGAGGMLGAKFNNAYQTAKAADVTANPAAEAFLSRVIPDIKPTVLPGEIAQTGYNSIINGLKTIPGQAATGAIIGAGGAAATGQDPYKGAMYGAGTAVAAGKVSAAGDLANTISAIMGRLTARHPNVGNAGIAINQAGINTSVPMATPQQLSQPANPFDQFDYNSPTQIHPAQQMLGVNPFDQFDTK